MCNHGLYYFKSSCLQRRQEHCDDDHSDGWLAITVVPFQMLFFFPN